MHLHPDRPFAHEHLGLDFGKTEAWIVLAARDGAAVARRLARRRRARHAARLGRRAGPRRPARRAEPAAGRARATRSSSPPACPTRSATGILIAELQEPTDLSVLLEWDGFGIADEQAATLGLGWDVALASVERDRPRRVGPARAGRRRRRLRVRCPPRRAPSSPPSASAPEGGTVELAAGFAVVLVVEGAGTLAGLEVTRGDALLVPHAAGPVDAHGDLVALVCRPPEVPAA